MKPQQVFPKRNMYRPSESYGQPFGVVVMYEDRNDGTTFTGALCRNLTKKQREQVKRWKRESENWTEEDTKAYRNREVNI